MTLRMNAFISVLLLSSATVAQAHSSNRTLAVFVTAAPGVGVAADTPEQTEKTLADALNTLKALERSSKSEHGGKRERWPASVEERYRAAEEAVSQAAVRRFYGVPQEKLADSVEDVTKGLTGAGLRGRRENVVLVDAPSEAHLIVEIRGRQTSRDNVRLFGRHFAVLFAVKPGPKLTTEQFARIPRTYRHNALLVRPIGSDAPEWLWEAAVTGSWKLAGAVASSLVDQFIESHYDALTQTGPSR